MTTCCPGALSFCNYKPQIKRIRTKFEKFCVKTWRQVIFARFPVLLVRSTSSKGEQRNKTKYFVKFCVNNYITTVSRNGVTKFRPGFLAFWYGGRQIKRNKETGQNIKFVKFCVEK